MNIEEKLEALTQTVELLAKMQIKTEENLNRLTERVDRIGENLDRLSEKLDHLRQTVEGAFNQIARILLSHEQRLDSLEGHRQ